MARVRIKFCGVMTPADARLAATAGADAVGMILHAKAKRLIDLSIAKEIVAALPPYVSPVGVFVNPTVDHVREVAAVLSMATVQLHGDESPEMVAACGVRVIKSIKVDGDILATLASWRAALAAGACTNLVALLLESAVTGHAGGTGVANDFAAIARLASAGAFDGLPPIVLSGGLTPENVAAAVAQVRPYAVDVSSGIESTFGQKSVEKMNAFAAALASR